MRYGLNIPNLADHHDLMVAMVRAAGATRWMEGVGDPSRPFPAWRDRIRSGPPRVAP